MLNSSPSRPISVKTLDHVVIRANNAAVLVAFYKDIIGCPIERELPDELGLTQLRAGTALIDIIAVDSQLGKLGGAAPGAVGHNMDHFCFTIESVNESELISYLQENGVRCGKFSERYGAQGYGRSVYLKDPEGNTLELKFAESSNDF